MHLLDYPLDTLSRVMAHAQYTGLPNITENRNYGRKLTSPEEAVVIRRPTPGECAVLGMFPQQWSSTALGFGGIGGQAFTSAYTIIIGGPDGTKLVYFGGRFAYSLPSELSPAHLKAFEEDLSNFNLVKCMEAVSRYGAAL